MHVGGDASTFSIVVFGNEEDKDFLVFYQWKERMRVAA
jgi:hypothetical protein